MANFRTTADYLDSILLLAGETTNGNSAYEARALHYLNQIHNAIISGGNEFNMEVDELWPWALAPDPIIIELQPKYNSGTISLTNGASGGTFSAAPAISLEGYHIQLTNSAEIYRIIEHTAGQTAFDIEGAYPSTTASGLSYTAALLDYPLLPTFININAANNLLPISEATASTELTATIADGSHTISELATALQTALNAAGASAYTVTYSTATRKFTITSDGAGADGVFKILGATGTEATVYASILSTLGFGLKDYTGALSYTAERPVGSIAKLVEPFKLHTDYQSSSNIYGIDKLRFSKDYPISLVSEGKPSRFTILEERNDGYIKVRFNKYPDIARRVEIYYIPAPLDLYDTTTSHPLIPRKYSRLLEYGGAAYLLAEKNDNRSGNYFTLATQLLEAMMKNNRKNEERIGEFYGEIIAREDLLDPNRKKLLYGEPEDA